MNRSSSIFYGITKEDENTITEVLCNLFRYKYFRNYFLCQCGIDERIVNLIKLENISTQEKYRNVGIPDIVINNDDTYYMIENKIRNNTPLQPTQVYDYPELIRKTEKSNKGLIFILPHDYKHIDNIKKAKNKYPFINIVYWENIIEFLYSIDLVKESSIIKESIQLIVDLVIKTTLDTILTPYEVAMLYNPKDVFESLKLIQKVINLIKNTDEKIVKELGKQFSSSDWANDLDDICSKGRYINYKNESCIFIGLNLNLIEKGPDFYDHVFGVAFEKRMIIKNFKIGKEYSYREDNDWIYIKIPKDIILSENQNSIFTKTIIEIIQDNFVKNLK
jgi:hypothetical protein